MKNFAFVIGLCQKTPIGSVRGVAPALTKRL